MGNMGQMGIMAMDIIGQMGLMTMDSIGQMGIMAMDSMGQMWVLMNIGLGRYVHMNIRFCFWPGLSISKKSNMIGNWTDMWVNWGKMLNWGYGQRSSFVSSSCSSISSNKPSFGSL